MWGKTKIISPGCIKAKWRTQPYHSLQYVNPFRSKYTFYVGDGIVRVVCGSTMMQMIPMRFKPGGVQRVWSAFIESLMKIAPDMDFGLRPGDAELAAVQFVGDGTEQVFVSTTRNSPSLGGAVLGGLLFGSTGAIIGASAGTSYTTGRSSVRFSDTVLTRARYTNGLIAEGMLSRRSPVYHEIMVRMSQLSESIDN
jgi:hypothetical protein